jgi:glycosyltransferase involved in cell wall biosynthesis
VADVVIVGIDDRTTDDTRKVAREAGARVFDFHFDDDFAHIRNQLWKRAKRSGARWIMWLDADDVLRGGAELIETLEEIEVSRDDLMALQMPYFYAWNDDLRGWAIIHDRVRVVRAELESYWENRIHEVLRMPSIPMVPGAITSISGVLKTPQVSVEHHKSDYQRERDPDRNLRIINKMMQDDETAGRPVDAQNLYHLALEAVARGQWREATFLFKRYVPLSGFREQIYEALIQMGMCYRQLALDTRTAGGAPHNDLHEAMRAYLSAIQISDQYPDAWYGLASAKFLNGEAKAALRHLDRGDQYRGNLTPSVVGIEPGRVTFDPLLTRLNCLGAAGDLDAGLALAKEGVESYPNVPQLRELFEEFQGWKMGEEVGVGATKLAEGLDDEGKTVLAALLPKDAWMAESVRNAMMEGVIAEYRAKGGHRRVVFVCGEALEAWGPDKMAEEGLGGSESAVVNMALEMARRGMQVEVFNKADVHEGVHGGVLYANVERYPAMLQADLTIMSRMPDMGLQRDEIKTDKMWLWCHDLHYDDQLLAAGVEARGMVAGFDRIMPVSEWHEGFMRDRYPWIPDEVLRHTRNGIDLLRFAGLGVHPRQRRRCVYMSSHDRGLSNLLEMWPAIWDNFNDAELHIYYGWQTFDLMSLGANNTKMLNEKAEYMRRINSMADMGVTIHGRVGQRELAEVLLISDLWLYPTAFLETSCITAMEAQAAGCVGIATACGAIPETLGDRGILLEHGYPHNEMYRSMFLERVESLMTDEEHVEARREKMKDDGLAHLIKPGMFDEMLESLPRDVTLEPCREAGINYAHDHFGWAGVADEWIEAAWPMWIMRESEEAFPLAEVVEAAV